MSDTRPTLLQVEDLHTRLRTRDGVLTAVNGLSFTLDQGETLAIVGESGCGKSMTALSIMRLVPDPPGRIEQGAVRFDGVDLLRLPMDEMRRMRGSSISMVFQEPMTSLNPVRTIGSQVAEAITLHQGLSRRAALDRAEEMLTLVRIPDARARLSAYPHQLSGGMRQRVAIAMALSCNPRLLLADEPTTALDVTIQAQIMSLIRELQERLGMALLLITHDLGLVAENADRVVVMYAGRKVEEASVDDLFATPCHPYTRGLLGSVPRVDAAGGVQRLREIAGAVPSLAELPPGCPFAPRCPHADGDCRAAVPPLEQKRPGQWAACWHTARVLAEDAA
jgi:oligopeptide/dipeptide ABC transporter ATP-binding protein